MDKQYALSLLKSTLWKSQWHCEDHSRASLAWIYENPIYICCCMQLKCGIDPNANIIWLCYFVKKCIYWLVAVLCPWMYSA